jgi:hypothetical protein
MTPADLLTDAFGRILDGVHRLQVWTGQGYAGRFGLPFPWGSGSAPTLPFN